MHPSPPATSPFKSTATPSPAFSDQKLPCESNFDPREREGESLSVFLLVNKAPGFVVADTRVDATVEDWFGKGVLRASVFTDFLGSNLKRKEKIPIKNFPIILFERILFYVKKRRRRRRRREERGGWLKFLELIATHHGHMHHGPRSRSLHHIRSTMGSGLVITVLCIQIKSRNAGGQIIRNKHLSWDYESPVL